MIKRWKLGKGGKRLFQFSCECSKYLNYHAGSHVLVNAYKWLYKERKIVWDEVALCVCMYTYCMLVKFTASNIWGLTLFSVIPLHNFINSKFIKNMYLKCALYHQCDWQFLNKTATEKSFWHLWKVHKIRLMLDY